MTRTLLIVDDVKLNREMLTKMLGDNYNILEAENGRDALTVMTQEYQSISAVLLDIGMPVMDGYEVLSHMKEDNLLSQIPVIVTTHRTDSHAEEKSLNLGAKDCISKPYNSVVIEQRIRNAINLNETEQANKYLSEQIQTIINDMPGGFARLQLFADNNIRPVYFNDEIAALTDMNRSEFLNIYKGDAFAGVHPDDMDIVNDFFDKMAADNEAHKSRYRLRHANDGYTWMSVLGRKTTDFSGKVFYNIYYTDASEQIKEEETRQLLLDNIPGGVGLFKYDDGILCVIYLNSNYWNLVGRNKADYSEITVLSAVHPDDQKIITHELNSAIEQMRDMVCDIRLRHETDEYIPVRLVAHIVPEEDSKYFIYAVFTPVLDESASYQNILSLLLSAVMDSTTDLSFSKDINFRYLTASRTFKNMVGLNNNEDITGKTDYDLFEKEMADKFRKDDEALIANGRSIVDMIEAIPSDDDSPHYSSTSKYLLRDGSDRVIGLYGVGRDITKAVVQDSQLTLINESIPGGLATFICTSGSFSHENIKLTYFNDGFCKMFGYTRKEFQIIADLDPISMIFNEDRKIISNQWLSLMEKGTPIDCLYRAHINNGGYKWISHKAVAAERQGDVTVVYAILQDVTDQKELIEQLRISEEENRLADILSGSIVMRYTVADQCLTLSSDVAAIHSLPVVTKNVPQSPVRYGLISRETSAAYIKFFEDIRHGGKTGTVTFQQKFNKGWRWMEAKSITIFSNEGKPIKAVISLFDVTDRIEKELETKELLEIDQLTGILNRTAFSEKVNRILRSSDSEKIHAMLMLDIDGFKRVNDVLGHGIGDQTLIETAELLRSGIRRADLVSRLGGDEFIIFMFDIPDKSAAAKKAEQICELSKRDLGANVQISGSIGIALYPQDGSDFNSLYKKIDDAMYYVKKHGKNNYAFYQDEMSTGKDGWRIWKSLLKQFHR